VSRPRVILGDDHRMVSEGLHSLLEPRFDVVAVVEDGRTLLEVARSLKPDVVVADISMPHLSGIEVTARLLRDEPQIKVVILTMHREEAYARRALEAGASGYVLKVAAADELVIAIEVALAGRTYVTPELERVLVTRRQRVRDATPDPAASLTERQREILQLLAEGMTAKEIGSLLGISARTVESHKYELMQALGLTRSAELVQFAVRCGLVVG
jgi:DNA-binding NarL/FixJ family response regulator